MLQRCASYAVLSAFWLCARLAAGDSSDRTFTSLGGGQVGDSGGVGASGNLRLSLPLALPLPRGHLNLPFAVMYTGTPLVGAAGVGWDIPIAGVLRQRNVSRRKPVHHFDSGPGRSPETADRVLVDIGSGPMLMSPTAQADVFQPFAHGYFRLEADANGFTGRDGQGRVWSFERLPGLYNDDFAPLTRITDATGRNRVEMHYQVYDRFSLDPIEPPFEQELLSVRELLLSEITHSYDMAGQCPKYRIQLEYWNGLRLRYPVPYPELRTLDFLGGHPRARTRILRSVRVRTQSTTACAAASEKLERTYRLEYESDTLTGQPRLANVDMYTGGDTAPSLPLIAYRYGSIVNQNAIRYGFAEIITLPPGPPEAAGGFKLSYAETSLYGLFRHFADLNGDGRADYLTLHAVTRRPAWSVNRPDSQGNDMSGLSPAPWTTVQTGPYAIGTADLATNLPILTAIDNTWQQLIDFNGDGRADLLVASAGRNLAGQTDPNFWMLLVNTPGQTGRPEDIVWLERQIDIRDLRNEIRGFHALSIIASTAQAKKALPLARTHKVGGYDATTTVEADTLTQWKLIDVNGDGYPDFVFDRLGMTAYADEVCDEQGLCRPGTRQDHFRGNQIMVIYHTGPMMSGSGAGDQARWRGPAVTLRTDGACGIERLRDFADGRRRLECGFVEASGDGIADYVVRTPQGILAIRSPGLAEELDRTLPENQLPAAYSEHERKRSIVLPGPPLLSTDPRRQACTGQPGSTTYLTEQQAGLRDLTGDGIADYVYYGPRGALPDGTPLAHPDLTPQDRMGTARWWMMAGTGVGFAVPMAIEPPEGLPFALNSTRERCDGRFSQVLASLEDLDGDGRPELVRSIALNRVRVAKILDSTGRPGAHDAGQLTAVDNRYGGVTEIRYGSAKAGWLTTQNLPGPEIVVTSMQSKPERGLASPLAATHYAYGGARQIYQPLMGRWIFPGYERRVTLRGEAVHGQNGILRGSAIIERTIAATENAGGLARLLKTGLTRDTATVSGILPADPRALLGVGAAQPRSSRHTEWEVKRMPGQVPPLVPLDTECYETPRADTPGIFGDLSLCRRTATVVAKSESGWEGSARPPSPASTSWRIDVISFDAFGRALAIKNWGDLATDEDDTCTDLTYAVPLPEGPLRLDAMYIGRVRDCANRSRIFAGRRIRYDALPEGQVGAGLPVSSVVERYDVSTGVHISQVEEPTVERDKFGNVVTITQTRADGASRRAAIAYDPFSLQPERVEQTATGLAAPLVTTIERDPYSLLPATIRNAHGGSTHLTYDALARLERVSVSKPGDAQRFIIAKQSYSGFSGGQTATRMITTRLFHTWTNEELSEAPAESSFSDETAVLDDFGQILHGLIALGADYGGRSMVVGSTLTDALGRPKFIADPHPTGGHHGGGYGTTFFYYPDGRLECMVEGLGVQSEKTTDESVDRYPHCITYAYVENHLVVRQRGPNELSRGKPQSGAFDEKTYRATGQQLTSSRYAHGGLIEHMAFTYDRLSGLSRVARWQKPRLMQGRVSWAFTRDSLGNVLTRSEPGLALVSNRFNDWAELESVAWIAGGIERSVRYGYDGLSRLTAVEELSGGQPGTGTARRYRYDVAAAPLTNLDPTGALGNLVEAESAAATTAFGWDWMGRPQATMYTDRATARSAMQMVTLGPLGQLQEFTFAEDAAGVERILSTYDSAQRPRDVRFQDASGTVDIWKALVRDDWGRVVKALSGNGAGETNVYRPERRREILSRTVEAGGASRKVVYHGYDGLLQLKGISEITTLGGNDMRSTVFTYDAKDRLARVLERAQLGVIRDTTFEYDGLGNLLKRQEAVSGQSLYFTADSTDPDRICHATPSSPAPPYLRCTWQYDLQGNVTRMGDGGVMMEHDATSRWTRGVRGPDRAEAWYGPHGELASLRRESPAMTRRDVHAGAETRVTFFDQQGQRLERVEDGNVFGGYRDRNIISEDGVLATVRRTDTGTRFLLFPEGEYQGTRVVMGRDGTVLQTLDYEPFGTVRSNSRPEDSLFHFPGQWNGGEAIASLGVTLLGSRVLDGATGRFLERDSRTSTASALGSHPYAFAWNNPVKWTDPSGAEPEEGDSGSAVSGLAALGSMLSPNASESGAEVRPFVKTNAICGISRVDCLGELEKAGVITLTRFERELARNTYYVIVDAGTENILGYLVLGGGGNEIRNRKGDWISGSFESALEPSMIQPGDVATLGMGKLVSRFLGHQGGKRAGQAAISAADEWAGAMSAGQGRYGGLPAITEPLENTIPHVLMNLPRRLGGFTTKKGDIVINRSMALASKHNYRYTLRHEYGHRYLTPKSGPLVSLRQDLSQRAYQGSHFARFVEEVVVETYATRSLARGFTNNLAAFPAYRLSGWRIAGEGVGLIAVPGGAGLGVGVAVDRW